jgi:methionine sulfoxide reductase heme-binding subunit
MLTAVFTSRYFIWLILTLPALPMISALASGAADDEGRAATEFLLHPTGEFSARFMIIAMMATPLRMLFPQSRIIRWFIKYRREFGVAACLYAAFHTLLYVIDMGSLAAMLGEFSALGIWTGWLAMFIFVPLGLTSNDAAVRSMGKAWKTLQRLVYPAAIATLVHWIFVHNNLGSALVHFVPLAGLEAYRIWHNAMSPRKPITTQETTT